MSVIFGIFYYYVIPNQLKKERIEDEKITKDLEKFSAITDKEKIEHIKNNNSKN